MAYMENGRNIYDKTQTGNPSPPNAPGEPAALTPIQVRRRMAITTAIFVLLMFALLGVGTWYLNRQEEQARALIPEEVPPLPPGPRMPSAALSDSMITLAPTSESAGLTAPTSAPPFEPERMAQAMSEVRAGLDYLQIYNWNQAELHARKALEIWPDMTAALRMLGVVYTQRGQFDQAIAYLERALKAEPFNVEIYINLSTAYMQKGQYDKAEELLKTALQLSPGYRVAYLNLGMLALLRGSFDAAADYLEQAIEQVPNDPPPRNNLAVALIRLGRFDEARTHLQYLVDTFPELPNPYFNMAITYVLENNLAEAMQWIRRGAQHCSPLACRQYLADADFDAIRGTPEFQALLKSLYPDVPELPE
jgi:Flp pilus assembly protein TadD